MLALDPREKLGTRTLRAYMQWLVANTPQVEKAGGLNIGGLTLGRLTSGGLTSGGAYISSGASHQGSLHQSPPFSAVLLEHLRAPWRDTLGCGFKYTQWVEMRAKKVVD